MYSNSAAVNRNDVQAFVQQAPDIERMLVADLVAPPFAVNETSFRWPKFTIPSSGLLETFDPNADTSLIQAGSAYPRWDSSFEFENDNVIKRGLEYAVDDIHKVQMNGMTGLDFEVWAATQTTLKLKLRRERELSNMLFSTTNGITSTNATSTWATPSSATVVEDIVEAIARLETLGYVANSIVIPRALLTLAKRSTSFLNYGKQFGVVLDGGGSSTSSITDNDFVAAFRELGIENLIVTRGSYQNNNRGVTPTFTGLWDQDRVIVGVIREGDPQLGGFARTVYHSDTGNQYQVQTYRHEERESDIVRIKQYDVPKIVDPFAAQIIRARGF